MSEQHQLFEQLKQIDENGTEFWSARAISKLLGYSEYRHFQPVIAKAKEACTNSGHAIEDHFEDILGMVTIGSGAQREVPDFKLATEEKLRRDNVQNKQQANQTHYEVGQKVRQTIVELGGTMPENLPAPQKSIKQLEIAANKLTDSKNKDNN